MDRLVAYQNEKLRDMPAAISLPRVEHTQQDLDM